MKPEKNCRRWAHWSQLWLVLAAIFLGSGDMDLVAQQVLDICGCSADQTSPAFNAGLPATYPPGTSGCASPCTSGTITFQLPPDGVLKFRSFTADGAFFIRFIGNQANTPVTFLVAGDMLLRGAACCYNMDLGGGAGSAGSSTTAGVGGGPGPGGFRGGDAAAQPINLVTTGGAGFGPGGGLGATTTANATGGVFFGLPELLPLVGGSGGGGGTGFGTTSNCTGGGGGGGGGAILIAVNGTLTMTNYDIYADGGTGGSVGNSTCTRGGAGGSAGAIRIVASRIVNGGTGRLFAQAGGASFSSPAGTEGRIRLESVDASAQTNLSTNPAAIRVTGPGPLSNPVSPTVTITQVSGIAVPALPQGARGSIDIVLPAPGVTGVNIATTGVPSGTTVEVKAKPRIGAMPLTSTVPLSSCDALGNCSATTTFNLSAGAYVLEARATFQVP
jgi:hypothetical protein